jgi:histidinol-phosphate aminotransferase
MTLRIDPTVAAMVAYHVPQPPQIRAKLDANELAFGLPAELRARLGAELATVPLERYPDPNARELRALVADQLGVGGDQLVFGNGSDELIGLLAAVLAGPVLSPAPSFVYYSLAASARGRTSLTVPLDARFELDEPAFERAIVAHRPAIAFLALPNNPTGTLWRTDFAVELAARHPDVAIVSDEAYFAYSGKTNLPHVAAHPNLIVMRTLSKVGFAGLRVGFTASSRELAHELEKVRPPYNVSAIDQRAACFALRECGAWSAQQAAAIVAERGKLAAALAGFGFEVFASEANLILVRRAGAGRLWNQLAERGIVVRDFDRPGPLAGCLRITVGTPAENALLVAALAELCAG